MKCHVCKVNVTPVRPKTTWKILTVTFWIVTLFLSIALTGFAFAGLQLILVPLALGIGMALGASARRLTSWTCPRCSTELIVPEEQTTIADTNQAELASRPH
jgi:hypothetical protein